MRIRVDNVGQVGIVKDIPGYELPPNAWTAGQNVRMQDGSVHKAMGYESLWTSPETSPYFLMPVQTPTAFYWLYCGLTSVYAIQNLYHFNLSSGTYNANAAWRWNGGNLGGVIVLNNGVDIPQYWAFPSSHATSLADLTHWPSTDRCRVLRPFKNFLVATNVTRSGTNYPTMVKWSHGADIGALPSSWSISDATLDAGETLLPQEGGEILDQKTLRDINILYRNDSTWAMQYIGAPAIFRFFSIFETSGILGTEYVTEFFGSHFVVTGDDVIVHDGQQVKSVANGRVRRSIFSGMSTNYYDRGFVVHNRHDKEMWICYPSSSTTCDSVWVWNYAEDSWAQRDLPNLSHVAYGVADSSAEDAWEESRGSWSTNTQRWLSSSLSWEPSDVAWSSDNNPWDYRTYDAQLVNLVFARPSTAALYIGDSTNQNGGTDMTSYIERTGLALIGPGKTDLYSRKQVRAVYPHIEGTNGGQINVYVGYQNAIDGDVTWSSAKVYTIGASYKVDFNVDGRLIAVKFESTSNIEWRLHGYQMDIEISGDA